MDFFAIFANPSRTLRFKIFYRKGRKENPRRSQRKPAKVVKYDSYFSMPLLSRIFFA